MSLTTDPPAVVPLEALRAAARALEGVAVRTPLVELPSLSRRLGVPIAVKCEQQQPTGTFKIRGAYSAIAKLVATDRATGVVTHSSGNHGQAVACAARAWGIRAVVVMPSSAPRIKVDGVRGYGGEVVFAGTVRSTEQGERAEVLAREEHLQIIPPYDHADVIAGQGTCGLEILEQCAEVNTILVPVGGGGLLAGIAAAVSALAPSVRLIGVEPARIPKLSAALAAGRPRSVPPARSVADGLLARAIGDLTFQVLKGAVREVAAVTEDAIAAAVRFLYHEAGVVAEPSGAVAVAALLTGGIRATGPTVAVLTGGNVDPDLHSRLVG
jgi:threonine dehydratase